MLRVFAWCLFVLSLLAALVAFAPFTPAIMLVVILLPLAAISAWRGARLPALLTGLGCIAAAWLSPLNLLQPGHLWPFALCVLGGFVLLAIALLRPQRPGQAKTS